MHTTLAQRVFPSAPLHPLHPGLHWVLTPRHHSLFIRCAAVPCSAAPRCRSNPQVSFGVFESEEAAARQYDRALILEKVRHMSLTAPTRR